MSKVTTVLSKRRSKLRKNKIKKLEGGHNNGERMKDANVNWEADEQTSRQQNKQHHQQEQLCSVPMYVNVEMQKKLLK